MMTAFLQFGLVLLLSSQSAGQNLVPNGGFEAGLWDAAALSGRATLDARSPAEGKRCLKLVSGEEPVTVRKEVSVLNHRVKYRISAKIRTWQLLHSACYIKLLMSVNGGPLAPAAYWHEDIGDPGFPDPAGPPRWKAANLLVAGGTRDWHEFHTTVEQTPKNADRFVLEIGLLAKSRSGKGSSSRETDEFGWLGDVDESVKEQGVAWIDDVRIAEAGHWPASGPCKGEIHLNGEVGVQYFHGRDAELTFVLTGYNPDTMKAGYRLYDGWGALAGGAELSPAKSEDGKWVHTCRHGGVGYFDVKLYAVENGTEYDLARTSYGILPKAPADYYEADVDSPFGLWVVLWRHEKGDLSLRDIGVKWTRVAEPWELWKLADGEWHEPRPGWARGDVDRYEPQNIHLFASTILRGTPKHLSSAPPDVVAKNPGAARLYPPVNLSDMDPFVQKSFEVYGGYPKVWSPFNETNYPWCWRAGTAEMVRSSKHFYDLIKRLDPEALVIGPSAGSWNVPYVEEFLEAGGAETIDGVDIHYNSQAGDMENMDFTGSLRELKTVMRRHGCDEKPIWITEFGVNCYLPHCTELNQAWRMVKAYVIGLSEGAAVMIYHCAHHVRHPWQNVWATGSSLIRRDVSPRHGYVAYGIMTRQLYKAKYAGILTGLPSDCVAHVFVRGREAVIVAWAKNKSDVAPWCKRPSKIVAQKPVRVSIATRARRVIVTDLFGKRVILSPSQNHVSLELDRAPIYVGLPSDGLQVSALTIRKR